MKKVFLYSWKVGFFIIEFFLISFLSLIIFVDSTAKERLLIPLSCLVSLLVIFVAVYFFKGISISYSKVNCVGIFSTRYSAILKDERTLTFTLLGFKIMRVEVFGYNTDGDASYPWLKEDAPTVINLFRADTTGNKKTVKKLLTYFEADESAIDAILANDECTVECEKITVSSSKNALDQNVYSIYFKETL